MSRVPLASFESALQQRLEDLWGKPVNLYRALGNAPAMVAAWTEFAQAIRVSTKTPRKLRELMILRGAQLVNSEYEWAQHLRMARTAGVREEQIVALAAWRESAEFTQSERAALALCEEVTAGRVSDAVHAEAMQHFSHAEYVELSLVAAFYAMVSRMLDAMAVPLDEDIAEHSPRLP